MLGFLTGIWGKVLGGVAAIGAVLGAIFLIRRDAAKDERQRITAETQRRTIEDMEKAREVEHRTAGLSDAEVRERLRALAARRNQNGGV